MATPRMVPLDVHVKVTGGAAPVLPPATNASLLQWESGRALGAIPPLAVAAYQAAAGKADTTHSGCGLPWQLLAAIGYVESDHASGGGSAARSWNGEAKPPIFGVALNGRGVGMIPDTDHGRLDGDPRWDRAVGPMQFIPSTWTRFAVDGDRDGTADPQNIWDASLAAANYLCTAAAGLEDPARQIVAVYSYNHSFNYVRAVLTTSAHYLGIDPAALGVNNLPIDPPTPSPTPAPSSPAATRHTSSADPVDSPPPAGPVPASQDPDPAGGSSPSAMPDMTSDPSPTP